MADEPRNPEPPKIKLTPSGVKPQGGSDLPPRIKIKPADKKSETARIDINSAHPPASTPVAYKELTKEELAEFYKKSTIRIDDVLPASGDTRQVAPPPAPDEAMRTTMRVDDGPSNVAGDTHKVQADSGRIDQSKRSTMRVEPVGIARETQKVKADTGALPEGAGLEKKKSETAKLEVPVGDLPKRSTSRITIDAAAAAEGGDVFKRKIAPVAVPSMANEPPARTPTVSLPRPKTMQMRPISARPTVAKSTVRPVEAAAVTEAKKSETARLDLPPETVDDRPSTRPKTIRIKRPDGSSARKPLMIARPEDGGGASAAAPVGGADVAADSGDEPGAIWAIAALLAVLATAALIYVLAAQTVAPTLPMPGRLV